MFWTRPSVPPPKGLHIEINKVCNLRCKTCMIWTNKEESGTVMSINRRREVIAEFAELSPQGHVFVCGGEPLLTPDRVFSITEECQSSGLTSQMATNGSLIDSDMAKQLVATGPNSLILSLNSPREGVHDRSRGRNGSYQEVTNALRLLQDERDRQGKSTVLRVNAIVSEQNYRDLVEFHDLVLNQIGADFVDLGFLQPTFDPVSTMREDTFFADNAVADEEELASILNECDRKFNLAFNPVWVEQVKMYHRSIREHGDAKRGWGGKGTQQHICGTYDKNIMVDPEGTARLCFSTAYRGKALKRRGDLIKFWNSATDIRRKMKKRHAYCGMADVFTRVSVTLPSKDQESHSRKAA